MKLPMVWTGICQKKKLVVFPFLPPGRTSRVAQEMQGCLKGEVRMVIRVVLREKQKKKVSALILVETGQ